MESDRGMRALLEDAARRAADYMEALPDRRVAPGPADVTRLDGLGGPVPAVGETPADVLALLDALGAPATVASAGGRYFGFVTGGVVPAALAASSLAAAWDQNAFSVASSPVGAALDEIALRWVADLLGLPAGTGGALVTGATMANFTALAAARHAVLEREGWDVERHGLFGAPAPTVVVGEEAHASLLKALGMLGLGRERVVRVAVDAQGRMRPDALPDLAPPAIVCLQAGNVNSGAFDPAPELIPAAHAAGAWVHVDGAFGLWCAASERHAHLAAGHDGADSWALDGHKWLNVPYDCGYALVREPAALAAAMSMRAAYLQRDAGRDPYDFTPESSRRIRGLETWAAIRSLGREGVAALVDRNCRQAARFAEGLAAAGFEVLNEVVANQVLVAFGDDEATRRVIGRVQRDGECWCGGTEWHGRAAMRVSVSSWATTDDDVERSIAAIVGAARAVTD